MLHSFGVLGDPVLGPVGQSDPAKQLIGVNILDAEKAGKELKVFGPGHAVVEVLLFETHPDLGLHFRIVVGDVDTEDLGVA